MRAASALFVATESKLSNYFDELEFTCRCAAPSLEGRFAKIRREIRELAKKTMTRRAWTKEDVRTLKTMAKAKAGVTRIAKSLKRTNAATTVKAASLGVSLSMR